MDWNKLKNFKFQFKNRSKGAFFHDLAPWNWTIKNRLFGAAIMLAALSIATPIYIRGGLTSIKSTRQQLYRNWTAITNIHRLNKVLSEAELNAFGYIKSHDGKLMPQYQDQLRDVQNEISTLSQSLT